MLPESESGFWLRLLRSQGLADLQIASPGPAVHPSDENDTHEFYLMTDDLELKVRALPKAGVECESVTLQSWGRSTRDQVACRRDAGALCAQARTAIKTVPNAMQIDHYTPPALHRNPAFTHVVSVRGADVLVFVSGQNAVDVDGNIVGDTFGVQTEQALRNVLRSACFRESQPRARRAPRDLSRARERSR